MGPEIFAAAGLDLSRAATLIHPGTRLGKLRGPLADLPALRDTELIAPACHDTASAIAGIPTHAEQWAYISSGTWSLIGALLAAPCNSPAALADDFTNLGAIGNRICFHKAVNGMWLLKQCMDTWALSPHRRQPPPLSPSRIWSALPRSNRNPLLSLMSPIPSWASWATCLHASTRSSAHMATRRSRNHPPAPHAWRHSSSTASPPRTLARLKSCAITPATSPPRSSSLAAVAAMTFCAASPPSALPFPVRRGAPESSTIGNLAVQLAALEGISPADSNAFAAEVSSWAATLLHSTEPASSTSAPAPACNAANS